MRAVFRLALGERLFLAVVGVGKVVDSGQQRSKHLAIIDDAADGSAAETDAMVAPLAADQARAGALALDLMVSQRDLERGIGRLRARIAEEHVIEPARRQIGNAAREFECLRNSELERRRVVQGLRHLGYGSRDLGAAMAGV